MAISVRHGLAGAVAAVALLFPAGAAQAAPLKPDRPVHETLTINAPYATCPGTMRAVGELDRTVHRFRDAEGDLVREFRNLRFDGQLVGANGLSLPYVGHWRVEITYQNGVMTGSTFQGLSRKVTLPDGTHLLAAGHVIRDAANTPIEELGSNTLSDWEATLCALLAE